jgi:hypothetical protein
VLRRAAPCRAVPRRAAPCRAAPGGAGPCRAVPCRLVPAPAGLSWAMRAVLRCAGSCWVVLGRAGPCWAVLGRAGPCWVVPDRAGPCWTVLDRAGPCRTVPGRAGPSQAVLCWAESRLTGRSRSANFNTAWGGAVVAPAECALRRIMLAFAGTRRHRQAPGLQRCPPNPPRPSGVRAACRGPHPSQSRRVYRATRTP